MEMVPEVALCSGTVKEFPGGVPTEGDPLRGPEELDTWSAPGGSLEWVPLRGSHLGFPWRITVEGVAWMGSSGGCPLQWVSWRGTMSGYP
jgi:hypothetical protein